MNYDEIRNGKTTKDFGRESLSNIRGKSTDAVDSRFNYGLGPDLNNNQNALSQSGMATQ